MGTRQSEGLTALCLVEGGVNVSKLCSTGFRLGAPHTRRTSADDGLGDTPNVERAERRSRTAGSCWTANAV